MNHRWIAPLFAAALAFAPLRGSADETAALRGVVLDGNTPIANANVRVGVGGLARWAATDESGRFAMVGLPLDRLYTIVFFNNPSGKAMARVVFDLTAGGTANATIQVCAHDGCRYPRGDSDVPVVRSTTTENLYIIR